MQAIIRQGCGYWDVTIYPMGGCFRRAKEAMPLSDVQVVNRYNDGSPRQLAGKSGNVKIAVDASVCDIAAELAGNIDRDHSEIFNTGGAL